MLLKQGNYSESLSRLNYNLKSDILSSSSKYFLIDGENGIGKSRFIEGVLLKEFKKNRKRLLYFGQDIENQILSFELISLVKTFINNLKKEKSFFKTIFLNDDSHNSIELDFSERKTLNPNSLDIKKFIIKECQKYPNVDVLIFDEVDKYFAEEQEFLEFIENINVKNIFIISHILDINKLSDANSVSLKNNQGVVEIELSNS